MAYRGRRFPWQIVLNRKTRGGCVSLRGEALRDRDIYRLGVLGCTIGTHSIGDDITYQVRGRIIMGVCPTTLLTYVYKYEDTYLVGVFEDVVY